ncbi:MAG: ribbon-helix-helix domain-containing protein [Nitrososphaerota archaeon]|nr:ribbon-helix-helix domain-containing protein [Aigarchaeota archaeon]MDW8077040.1 ribbon-helix-helix domain-containing protein [Nitrososphaerota archaeon]
MKLISVKMPEALIEGMDELVKKGLYPSRSAVMRMAVRDLLKNELGKFKSKDNER